MDVIVEAIALKGFPQSCQKYMTSGLRTATYKVTISVDGKALLTCDFSGKGLPINEAKKSKDSGNSNNYENLGNIFTCKILNNSSVDVEVECKHSNVNNPHGVSLLKINDVGTIIKLNAVNTVLNLDYMLKNENQSGTLTLKVTRVSTTGELTMFKLPRTPVLKGDAAFTCPEWVNLLGSMGTLLKVAEPVGEVDPHAKIALSAAQVAFELFMKRKERDERVLGLTEVMGSTYQMILDSDPLQKCLTLSQSINDLIALTRECSYFIAEYIRSGSFGQRAVINAFSNADDVITQFEKKFLTLKETFFTGIMLSIGQITMQILDKLDVIDRKLDLIFDILSFPVLGRSWSKLDRCIEGTQKHILSKICDWGFDNNLNVPNIFLLLGVSKSAKTAIAHTVSSMFFDRGRLGATVFFDLENVRNVSNFFPSIIRELSSYHPAVHAQVMAGLKTRNVKFINDPPARQFHFLSQVLSSLTIIGPILLVIDSFEKCVDRDIILQYLVKFTKNIRLLITSEPTEDIMSALSAKSIVYQMNSTEDQDTWSFLILYIQGFLKILEELRPALFNVHPCEDIAQEIYLKCGQIDYISNDMLELIDGMEDETALVFIEEIFGSTIPENETVARENIARSCNNLLLEVDRLGRITRNVENQAELIKRLVSCGFIADKTLLNLSLSCEPPSRCNSSKVLYAMHKLQTAEYPFELYRHRISHALHCIITCKCSYPPEALKEENKLLLECLIRNHQTECIHKVSPGEYSNTKDVPNILETIERHHTILQTFDGSYEYISKGSQNHLVYLTPPLQHSGLSNSADKITILKIFLSVYSFSDIQVEAAIYRAVTEKCKDMLAVMQTDLDNFHHIGEPYNECKNAGDVKVVKSPLNGKGSWFVKTMPIDTVFEARWFNCPIPTSKRLNQDLSEDDSTDGHGIGFVNSLLPGDRIAILAKSSEWFQISTHVTLYTDPMEKCPPPAK